MGQTVRSLQSAANASGRFAAAGMGRFTQGSSGRGQLSAGLVADLAALAAVALVIGLFVAGLPANNLHLNANGTLFALVMAAPLVAASGYLATRDPAVRRRSLRSIAVAGLSGAAFAGAAGFVLSDEIVGMVIAATWLSLPVVAFSLRLMMRQPAAIVLLRDRRRAMRGWSSKWTGRTASSRAVAASSMPPGEPLPAGYTPKSMVFKTAFDVLAAAAALLVLAPLMIILALLVRLDGGPVLYAHGRVGRFGQKFPCLKFRSMVVDGDAVLHNLLARDADAAAEWAATQKLRHDPRVTWIGRFLRRTSLDELPQLFNVLRRDMSLVGPRPIVSAEISRYGRNIAYYYLARPGITGLWQVSGRSDTTYAERVALDTAYVQNWSLRTDVSIVVRTIPAVLQRKGAV